MFWTAHLCKNVEVKSSQMAKFRPICGLYYKRVTIIIDPPSVVKVMLQIVASLTIVIDDARLRLS